VPVDGGLYAAHHHAATETALSDGSGVRGAWTHHDHRHHLSAPDMKHEGAIGSIARRVLYRHGIDGQPPDAGLGVTI